MAKWITGNDAGDTLGEFPNKSAMFAAMKSQLGIGGRFCAVSSQGAFYAFIITEYGYNPVEKVIPSHLQRDGRKHCAA